MRYHVALISLAVVFTATDAFAQREQINLDLIGEFVFVAAEGNDAAGEVDGSREVTVEVKRDGKTITITQTVKGEFIGEIVDGDETTEIRAKSLDELKEKSPLGHAAFHEKPATVKPADAQAVSVSVSDNNGDRKVEIQEAGRKVILRDQRGKQFGITVKQNLEHGIRVERVDAADMAALKKIAPELAKLAELHAEGANVAPQIRVQALPGRVGRAIPNSVPAGPRRISGEYDGGKVVIRDENGKDIRITITKTVDGKEDVEEIAADDFDSLKKQNPKLAEVYEKLAGKGLPQGANQFNNGNIIIGNAGGRVQVQAQAAPIPAVPPARELAQLKAIMEMSKKKLERLAADPKVVDQETAKKLTDDIDAILEKLNELDEKAKP